MKVIIACEFSGVVREAFIAEGHQAISCDLLETEIPGPHIIGDIREVKLSTFDLMIAHPPCTYLARSGARWWASREKEQADALNFVKWLMNVPVPRIALENPVGIISRLIRKPDFITYPYWFGDPIWKTVCFWLKNLKPLIPTEVLDRAFPTIHHEQPGPNRWKNRSRFFPGMAKAMAMQWGAA